MPIVGEFTRGPEFKRVELDYQGVTGHVDLIFTNGAHCSVRPDGAYNTNSDRVYYRGKEYLPHISVRRLNITGDIVTWGIDPNDWQSLDAPRTYKEKIIAACVDAVQRYGTADVIREATYASAMTDLSRADREAAELESKLSEARAEQVRLRALVSRNAPRTKV